MRKKACPSFSSSFLLLSAPFPAHWLSVQRQLSHLHKTKISPIIFSRRCRCSSPGYTNANACAQLHAIHTIEGDSLIWQTAIWICNDRGCICRERHIPGGNQFGLVLKRNWECVHHIGRTCFCISPVKICIFEHGAYYIKAAANISIMEPGVLGVRRHARSPISPPL